MGYERYPRGTSAQDDDHRADYRRGHSYSGVRDYRATGMDRDRGRDDRFDDRDAGYGGRDHGTGAEPRGRGGYGQQPSRYGADEYRGGYGQPDHRFDGDRTPGRDRSYGRPPHDYEYDDRGFLARAGDEVRSWFGDEEAERRREADLRYDERSYGSRASSDRDSDYHSWRSNQISALDRDYDEYRREHRSKFESEFATWRTNRQGQRDQLGTVTEHMDVVGSDGAHVGTVDKVRGDRILLTKKDEDAHGRHHSIPSSWIRSVDTKVTLVRSADEAKAHWRDEERSQAMFGDRPDDARTDTGRDSQGRLLGRSFSGTY